MPDCHAGDVRWANVLASKVNGNWGGKDRPVVLVAPCFSGWWVAGLTTLDHYGSGGPRQRVPNPTACGLRDGIGSYLWGGHLVRIPQDDIREFIGRADEALARAIAQVMPEVGAAEVEAMLSESP